MFVALDLQDIVERQGFAVDGPYATVAEAITAIEDRLPLVAILDVQLMDGEVFPAADRLQAAGVPIIFHSGHADSPALKGRYPDAKVCAKPCTPGLIEAALTAQTRGRA